MKIPDTPLPHPDTSRLVIWGSGELGSRVGRQWRQIGQPVVGITQSNNRHTALQNAGIRPVSGSAVDQLTAGDLLVLALPGHLRQQEAVETLEHSLTPPPDRVIMISSTGYYGLASGLVDEDSPHGPDERSARIAAAEDTFRGWAGGNGIIIRLGGLYRQGRGPMAALARKKGPKLRPPDKTLALIHYDDAATAIFAALRHQAPEKTYLAVTPPCPTRQEFYEQACHRLSLPKPAFDTPLGRAPAQYNVARLRRDLLPEPAYPTWQAALII